MTVGTQDQKGYRGIRGHWEPPRGCRGHLGVSWGLAGTGYSGSRRGIGALGAPRRCRGHLGVLEVYWELAGTLGTQGPEGYQGVLGVYWGLAVTVGTQGLEGV